MTDVWMALGLTLFAGLATGIGSMVAFTAKRTNYRFLSVATGFSAGVMLYVSFVEIFYKGVDALTTRYGDYWGHWVNAASFFGGMLLIGLIDNLIPAPENPHETPSEAETAPLHDSSAPVPESYSCGAGDECLAVEQLHEDEARHKKLMRMGLFTALAIAIHNFPEGLATFLAALQDPALGVAIAVAIALHNIPEGISVVRADLLRHRRQKKGVCTLLSQRSGRTGGCRRRLSGDAAVRRRRGGCRAAPIDGGAVWRRCRHHGLHQPGRAFAHQPGLRQGS